MFGRMDLAPAVCPDCTGSGKDPRKRKRQCLRCGGTGRVECCSSCGHLMPCPGTNDKVFDQSYCNKPNDRAQILGEAK